MSYFTKLFIVGRNLLEFKLLVGFKCMVAGVLIVVSGLSTGLLVRADEPEQKQPGKKMRLGDLIDSAAESIVRINVLDGSGMVIGYGTGFVIDSKGYVATNYHVTRSGTKITVEFRDGLKNEVSGYRAIDREGDLAVLELSKPQKNLKALRLGSRTLPRQGDSVIAIGHPQGLNFTVTTGIISAVRKTSDLPKEITGFVKAPADQVWIQNSAAISPGSSGGPLFDENGSVIAINTWIADGQNLGFGIHTNHLTDLLAKATGKTIPLIADSTVLETEKPLETPQPKIRELMVEYQQANLEFRRLLSQAKSRSDFEKMVENENPSPKFAKRFFEIANANRRSLTGFQALTYAIQLDAASNKPEILAKALGLFAEDHGADKGMQEVLLVLAQINNPAIQVFYKNIISKSKHLKVRALATLGLSIHLATYGGSSKDQERLLESCQNEFKDVVAVGDTTIGTITKPMLFKLRYLSVGKKAPDIEGKDADGKEFKLSQYRGKVVLIDFFADWCPHCVRMYPHERKMVEEYAGKPFAILGVNTDSSDTLSQIVQDKKVTWRCWADGRNGPISQAWQIESYPALFLLDHEGVIRKTYAGRPNEDDLTKDIKDLIEKAPSKTP